MNDADRIVAGESIAGIMQGLRHFRGRQLPDGMFRLDFSIPPGDSDPLLRALMRVEAELLLADADTLGTDDPEQRTPENRRADALVLLVRRMAES